MCNSYALRLRRGLFLRGQLRAGGHCAAMASSDRLPGRLGILASAVCAIIHGRPIDHRSCFLLSFTQQLSLPRSNLAHNKLSQCPGAPLILFLCCYFSKAALCGGTGATVRFANPNVLLLCTVLQPQLLCVAGNCGFWREPLALLRVSFVVTARFRSGGAAKDSRLRVWRMENDDIASAVCVLDWRPIDHRICFLFLCIFVLLLFVLLL